ncbi:disease resistance protein RPV1-like [Cornus florida]|uniref:disease resistance protein RPV1-like n=1 Tax=Cornus florida TaxID=4283 RepID=UPI00289B166D|nr:disease resistance protein RPV1-like [Cornus florida]
MPSKQFCVTSKDGGQRERSVREISNKRVFICVLVKRERAIHHYGAQTEKEDLRVRRFPSGKQFSVTGFQTFWDDEIERGENFESELRKAIEQSSISIIVFSKNYASSRWCLEELVKILQCKRINSGRTILPVFYYVYPSQVRNQTGSFAEAFAKHEEKLRMETDERKKEYWMEKMKGWREALGEVANSAGMTVEACFIDVFFPLYSSITFCRYESKFIHNIVKEIENKLNDAVLSLAMYPIGLGSRVGRINLWLQDGSSDVGIMVIFGMGGIGKTTIARKVYNLNFERFEGRGFLENIRITLEQSNGLLHLQKQLLSDISKRKMGKIYSVDEGTNKIKRATHRKRVLLVLDDVDKSEHSNAILAIRTWLYPGSKIIITTRHENLLEAHQDCEMYRVEELSDKESLELFCWHAFGKDHPTKGFMEHSRSVVLQSGGLPLALQVLGSSLSGKGIDVWEIALEKLEAIPDGQILEVLKISYDSLQDDHDKNLFLDIACFFVGKDKDHTVEILDQCGFYTTVGIQNLIDRCLLKINKFNKLVMHQLIRDMGREIIRQESPKELGKSSRLLHHKDVFDVLREKTGRETIEGLYPK